MREKVQKVLANVRKRLRALRRAEQFRLGRTRYWKTLYQRRLKKLGAKNERTRYALHKYRTSRALGWKVNKTQAVLHRRAENKIKWLRKHPPPVDPDGDGLIWIDNKQLSKELGLEVLRIRAAGRWGGYVVSGYRTPAYSQQLCYGICGASRCPGLCAGTSSNHTQKGGRSGAVDLTDYYTFAAECRRMGSWLENHLPRDLVHFSDSGV